MFSLNGLTGSYPALSITAERCALQCDHCRGKTLEPMIPAETPERLLELALRLARRNQRGLLISGGCDAEGRLPWEAFIGSIAEIKRRTDLFVSIHCGLVDYPLARRLKEAGVDQALIDVIGDDETYRAMYHVNFGIERILESLESLQRAHLTIIPHIVCGLHRGEIVGERRAIEALCGLDVPQVVIVALMRIRGTPSWEFKPLAAEHVAALLAEARLALPRAEINLGCARQRGDSRLELLAIDAGANRLALPSEEAVAHARGYGLEIRFQRTCCSVSRDFSTSRMVAR